MKELLAGIVAAVLSVFGGHQAVSDSASNAAAAASIVPSAIVATSSTITALATSTAASSTIVYQTINQPVIERTIERTLQTAAPSGYVTQEAFTTAINELSDRFGRIISGSTYPVPASNFGSGGIWNAIAASNKIDQLSGTSLSDITVDGVSGLTATDIPDLSGAYLSIASTSTARSILGITYTTLADLATYKIAAWGDSLTEGLSGGNNYPSQISTLLNNRVVYNGGVGGETGPQISARMLAATDKYNDTTVILVGRNDIYNDPTMATTKANVNAMVAALQSVGNSRFVILSIPNGSGIPSGSAGYNSVIEFSNWVAATYPDNYVDVRSYLVSQYNPLLPQDVVDYGNDVVPASLRSDTIHLNGAGYALVAEKVVDAIRRLEGTSIPNKTITADIAFPFFSLITASSSNKSTALGIGAGAGFNSTSTNLYNLALGMGAMATAPITGLDQHNVAAGYQSLYSNNAGYQNTAVGSQSMYFNTAGYLNTAIGMQALYKNTNGYSNTAVGAFALSTSTTGYWNTAVGLSALRNSTTGYFNTAAGVSSLNNNTTGFSNVSTGVYALYSNSTGYQNTALGTYALQNNSSATSTVAIGYQAGNGTAGQTHSANNVFVGTQAGFSNTTGNSNTLIGFSAGYGLTYGASNIVIGSNVDAPVSGGDRQLNIGNVLYGVNMHTGAVSSAPVLNGKIGIGTTSPYAKLSIHANNGETNITLFAIASSTAAATTTLFSVANTGNVTVTGSAATCTLGNGGSATNCSSSDQRLKDNITTIDASTSLAAVESLRPVSFKWNQWMVGNGAATSTQFGFIAQEIMNTFPNLVALDAGSRYYKLDYQGLFAPLVGAVQALAQKVADFTDSFTTKELTFTRAIGDEITVRKANIQQANVQELCVGSTCLTESQVQALLSQAGQQPSAPSEIPQESEAEEPQADEPILPATPEEPAEADHPIPEISDAPPTAPDDTPEETPVTEPVNEPVAQ